MSAPGVAVGLITTRYGFADGPDGTAAPTGLSLPPYESFNLGAGIGDEPEAVQANRSALAARVGLAPDALVWMGQVHGTAIAEVAGPSAGPLPAIDGMVSTATGIGLAVTVADCVPVLAADREARVIGAAHAGRLGAAAGLVPDLISRMVLLGARPGNVEVLVGPAICGRCYEVPVAMRDDVERRLPGSACTTAAGTPGLDLRAGVVRQLRELAVGVVHADLRCTREDPTLFSHRRSALTGRFAAVVRQ